MTRKRRNDYHRWDFEGEVTELGGEEDEINEDESEETVISGNGLTTFLQANGTRGGVNNIVQFESHHRKSLHHTHPPKSWKEKIHLLCLSLAVFLFGFLLGTSLTLSMSQQEVQSIDHSDSGTPSSSTRVLNNPNFPTILMSPLENNSVFSNLLLKVTAKNIGQNLRKLSQEPHIPGTPEGKTRAMVIRDLWRSYGLSVRIEQHKALIPKASSSSFLEVYSRNGSLIWRTSSATEDKSASTSRPFIAFSPPANLNGTLIYGHYGTVKDFQLIQKRGILLSGTVVLLRFGTTHLAQVVATAASLGVVGLIFYPDPADFGPHFPSNGIRWDSLLGLAQFEDYLNERYKPLLPALTISPNEARSLLRLLRENEETMGSGRSSWKGGLLRDFYPTGGITTRVGLRIFTVEKTSSIYNVVAAIPGAWESDRYVIVGCAHDSWTNGAGDPGIGIAVTTELVRSFESTVQSGWKPRRSVLFISWDAHLYANAGVHYWLQEHHFEIWSRAVAYIDLSQLLHGNQTLHVISSPLLKEVARKTIERVKKLDELVSSGSSPLSNLNPDRENTGILFSSILTGSEASFAFFETLGIPFIRFTVTNSPKGRDYPLFNTAFDTFDNFANLVDPGFTGAETLGRIISGLILLLVDSCLLPMNVEDYVEEIQRSFASFMTHAQEDFHRANISIAYLQAAVMRLGVIGDNFRTDIHNRSVVNPEQDPERDRDDTSVLNHLATTKKLLFHRIINDKLMGIGRAFLSSKPKIYKHQLLGYSLCSWMDKDEDCIPGTFRRSFPKLRQILECQGIETEGLCTKEDLELEVSSLIRGLDAAAAILQSPLLPEESESALT